MPSSHWSGRPPRAATQAAVVRSLRGAAFAMALLAGAAAARAAETASPARAWETLPRLTDIRYDGARELAPVLRSEGRSVVELPWNLNLDGRRSRRLEVGPAWLRLVPEAAPAAALPGAKAGAAGSDPDAGSVTHLDLLPGGIGSLAAGTSILLLVKDDGLAIRWAGVATPAGNATFETLIDRQGRLTVQYFRVPPAMTGAIAGTAQSPLSVRPASASRLVLGRSIRIEPPRLPSPLPGPHRSDPPPVDCVPETGTWCDRADGPGTSEVWISEGFDDLASRTRGWTASGLWHESDYTNCTPGAFWDPGASWYFGVDGTCAYTARSNGTLASPAVGPIGVGTVMTFASRIAYEGAPFDTAEIFINGTLLGNMPTNLDPSLWYQFDPINLDFWAGQLISIEFVFDADNTVHALGWFVDDVMVWNPNVGNPDCIRNAGLGPAAACDDRQATAWTFNESQFCTGCSYSFYVLVECGREMHLPLDDMEGADIRITNVEFPGAPPPLRCVNTTARADAGLTPYRGTPLPAEGGGLLDCCLAPAGPEVWYGPPFDVTDSVEPGRVAWGLSDGCPSVLVYDTTVPPNGLYTCTDIGGSCGQLDRLSPGENQVMDCFITNDAGLCGLYRVDVVSGGNVWTLFANCDGTDTPQFPIFFDCTEAWAAYNPLPELAVSNLVVAGACPDLAIDFDIVNLGCTPHLGDAVALITVSGADATCGLPPELLYVTVPGPFAPGASVHVSETIVAPCTPARVDVTADPDDLIPECTENPGAAACRAEAGVDTLSAFTCGCAAQILPHAGVDQAACAGELIMLSGEGSVLTGCATRPLYRWLDASGAVIRDWDPSPRHSLIPRCPAGGTFTLEVSCEGEPCVATDTTTVTCIEITADPGPDVSACAGGPLVLDGSASVVTNCATPIYRWIDGAGNEVRGWSTDPEVNIPAFSCASAGDWLLEVGCQGETCTSYEFVTVTCVEVLANAGPDLTACEGVPVTISGAGATARGCTSVVYQWFDATGAPISGVLTDPEFELTLAGCPGIGQFVLVAACADPGFETCGTFDVMQITCGNPAVPVPVVTPTCSGAAVACGVAEAGTTYWWDADVAVDSGGDGINDNDADLAGCDGVIPYPDATVRTARAWAEDALGCRSFADADASALPAPAPPVPVAEPGCPGADSTLRCGSAEPGVSWDFDVAVDADGNRVPDDDEQATTCEALAAYPAGTYTARVTVTDAGGCSASATVTFDVLATTAPAEATGDRVTRSGASLTIRWDPVAGAATYRVSRGTIGTWYDHAADAGRGTCDSSGATTFTDPDDATDGADWYYLITAVETCGLEGPAGQGTDGVARFDRPARAPTAGCP